MGYPWSERFIEIAIRAIVKTHWNYQIWGMGQPGHTEPDKILKFGYGEGIELADEVTVCSVITQDALNSSLFTGVFVPEDKTNNVKAGLRYWRIDRELKVYGDDKRCDIVVQRYSMSPEGKVIDEMKPVIIEAKRYTRYTTDLISKGDNHEYQDGSHSINADIENKLKKLDLDSFKAFVLTWGTVDEKHLESNPANILSELKQKNATLNLAYTDVRWQPLSDQSHANMEKAPDSVKKWIWVALIEVTTQKPISAP